MPSWRLQNLNLNLNLPFTRYFSSRFLRNFNDHDSEFFLLRSLSERKLREARELLDRMPQRGVVHWTSMLSKYARGGFIAEARTLFEIMPERNLVTYNVMLSAYMHSGRITEACKLFDEMPERNVVSWTAMLSGYTNAGRVEDAKEVFNNMPERNVVTWNSMVVGLIRNGDLVEARIMFDVMPVRNVVSWNVMIVGYAENDMIDEARVLFDAMLNPNVVTWTSLIVGYCQAGDVEEGYRLFQRMPDRNLVSWTAMIGGFVWNGFYNEALLLFLEMTRIHHMRPNGETFISLVYACSRLCYLGLCKQVHAQLILSGLCDVEYDGRFSKSLIHMYCELGVMDFARFLYSNNNRNNVIQSCNSMIKGYVKIGLLGKARRLFDTILIRDKISWTSMITGYFHAGNVQEACCLFDRMPERDDVAWTVMISGHIQNEFFSKATYYFVQMLINGVRPLDSTFSALLGAAGATANLNQGKQFHCQLMKTKPKFDILVGNSLISMYAKCGEIDEAHHIFSNMICRDIVSWNSMIIGLSYHGLVSEALELLDSMQDKGIHPNSVTFLGLLSGCSHTGMVVRGWELFNSMSSAYDVQPGIEHCICMVDLLGRAGLVKEAEEFVMKLPFEPCLSIWGALLGICGLHKKNAGVAKHAAQRVLELDPTNASAHVSLCNIYASIGQRAEEGILRKAMEQNGVRKVPGCSWIMVKGNVYVFLSGKRLQSEADEMLSLLGWDIGSG